MSYLNLEFEYSTMLQLFNYSSIQLLNYCSIEEGWKRSVCRGISHVGAGKSGSAACVGASYMWVLRRVEGQGV